jgi:hypothetical protein
LRFAIVVDLRGFARPVEGHDYLDVGTQRRPERSLDGGALAAQVVEGEQAAVEELIVQPDLEVQGPALAGERRRAGGDAVLRVALEVLRDEGAPLPPFLVGPARRL